MRYILPLVVLTLATGCGGGAPPAVPTERPTRHEDLVALFGDWRAFQRPTMVAGVPDYSAAAMTAQHEGLAAYLRRLAAFDTTGWSVAQQVDYHILRAELNGFDFDHRVLRPWQNNPAYYVTFFPDESDQPAREGPFAWGGVELWSHPTPLSAAATLAIDSGLRRIPGLMRQARTNLTGNQKDLWVWGTRSIRSQSSDLTAFIATLTPEQSSLAASARAALAATDSLAAWLDAQAPSKTGPSGVGRDNYDWYLTNVQLLPYTWKDEVTLMQRELARAYAYLALEEVRNRGRPTQALVGSQAEHERRFNRAVSDYMAFLRSRQLVATNPDLEARLRARIGRFSDARREFFTEVDYRDPVVMRTHGFHWFDKGAMAAGYGNPIRNGALLYNVFNARTEGLATGWEEMMMGAGLFDASPRSRELILILLAERAARAMGDLRMHANEWSIDQAAAYASQNTPRGWLALDGNLVWGEQHLYLQQPAYGVSYVIGKIEVEKIMQVRMRQLGERFDVGTFMHELVAAGQIPIALIRWQLTGELDDELRAMLGARASPPTPSPSH
ncbi:MAG: DUF885 family protein [Gemmatimonadaceae bacterium]|nr:DUF885 family protein [Gemmatimonadaceae bacterium]